jgi:hypothetical protein
VWHCQEHGEEFETQPEYVQHWQDSHNNSTSEHPPPALVDAVVGPSLRTHRDCPFCPTHFTDIAQMQSHIIFHLEQLAQLALHNTHIDLDNETMSNGSSQSHQVQIRGRQNSISKDFDTEEDRSSFLQLMIREVQDDLYNTQLTEEILEPFNEVLFSPLVDEWLLNITLEWMPDEPIGHTEKAKLQPSKADALN